jgi:predicted NBD/HSP70 family sugar kinase
MQQKAKHMNYSIGIDLGGTQIRAVRIGRDGQVHAHQRVATAATSGPQVVIGQIEQLVAAMVDTLEPYIRRAIAERAMPPFRDVSICAAQLGDDAGVIGAAALLL